MRIFSAEHSFSHPWETVTEAAWKKYPNPINQNVRGLDVIDRNVGDDGILRTHRLMHTNWGLPQWVTSLVGLNQPCYISEHSEVDPINKVMKMRSRNLTFCNVVTVDEQLTYREDPSDPSKTLVSQESTITVQGVPLTDYMESLVSDKCTANAQKGRQAMELVIDRLKKEADEIRQKAAVSIEDVIPACRPL